MVMPGITTGGGFFPDAVRRQYLADVDTLERLAVQNRSDAYGVVVRTRARTVDVQVYSGDVVYGAEPVRNTRHPLEVGERVMLHFANNGSWVVESLDSRLTTTEGDNTVSDNTRGIVVQEWGSGEKSSYVLFKRLDDESPGSRAYVADHLPRLKKGDHISVLRESGQPILWEDNDVSPHGVTYVVIAKLPSRDSIDNAEESFDQVQSNALPVNTYTYTDYEGNTQTETLEEEAPSWDPWTFGSGKVGALSLRALRVEMASVRFERHPQDNPARVTAIRELPLVDQRLRDPDTGARLARGYKRSRLAYSVYVEWGAEQLNRRGGTYQPGLIITFGKRTNDYEVTYAGGTMEHEARMGSYLSTLDLYAVDKLFLVYGGPAFGFGATRLNPQECVVFKIKNKVTDEETGIWFTFNIVNPPGPLE